MNSKRILWTALILSLLLHVFVLVFLPYMQKINLIPLKQENQKIDDAPLVFEFIETPDLPEVENAEEQNLVSDKSLAASDETDHNLPIDENPYSKGNTDIKKFSAIESMEHQQNEQPVEITPEVAEENSEETGDHIAQKETQSQLTPDVQPESTYIPPQSNYENVMTEVKNAGGVSFNTYKWDFAPYMLYLKKKIQGNLNPPPGFTHLGLIHGDVLVKFIIMPSGTLKNLEVLHTDAHSSLVQASTGAISISAPFLPLPDDFPEDYLVVTSLFSYIIQKD